MNHLGMPSLRAYTTNMPLQAQDVFTPGAFPAHTYVERGLQGLEQTLIDSLATKGQVVALSGPSKSGKTVLVEKVVGPDLLIPISGSSIQEPDDVWTRVLDWMNVPNSSVQTEKSTDSIVVDVGAKGSVGVPLFASAELNTTGKLVRGTETASSSTAERRGLVQVVHEIGNSDFVVLIDDFHYMPRAIQSDVAKSLKEAVRLGVKLVTATVSHRGDDVVRANPELRGRVRSIDLDYWTPDELRQIAINGFHALNADVDPAVIARLIVESAGSPQLMQLLCLQTCFVMGLRTGHDGMLPRVLNPSNDQMSLIFTQTSANTDYRSLVDVLDAGPRTRGTERKTYQFHDGQSGDVYRVVLRAVSSNPPQLSFAYDELLQRTAAVCKGESPVGSSVTGTCLHMARLAEERFPAERTIDWDESKPVFDLPDPYFMFYLRWSGRLQSL